MMTWVVHIVFPRGEEDVILESKDEAKELMNRIRTVIERKAPVTVKGDLGEGVSKLVLNPDHIVKAWIEEVAD